MNEIDPVFVEKFVRAALIMQGYLFDETRIAAIVAQYSSIESLAQAVLAFPLPFTAEGAAVFRA